MAIQEGLIQFEGDKQLLYRGAKLKNTKWIYGLVIYTGKNTKIMMNMDVTHNKISQIQKILNVVLIKIFMVQVLVCLLPAILYGNFRSNNQKDFYYIDWPSENIGSDSVLMFFSYFIIMSTFIPISLVISIEFVKVFQAYFINSDRLMYSQQRKQGVTAKTFSLNEQLGQIQYVFSDKTGTLTRNIMQFKIALIGNHVYGDEQLIKKCELSQSSKFILKPNDIQNILLQKKTLQMNDKLVIHQGDSQRTIQIDTLNQLFQEYFQILAMTHEVLSQKIQNNTSIYRGPSPDEIALVNFARDNRYEFMDSSQSVITIKAKQKVESFVLWEIFSFTSERKRMSIIFKDNQGNIRMYIKGADNVINQRLAKKQVFNLNEKVDKCSSIGLRTLLLATRIISEKQVSLLEGKDKEIQYQKLVSNLQSDLILIGATAVLDKLQDLVPETIKDLLKANIKVWMLTGDKLQTAENIAKSCNLIQKDFHIFKLSAEQAHQIQKTMDFINRKSEELLDMKISNALVLQGVFLSQIMGNQQLQKKLLEILERCEAVVCCRLLPLQKAQIVKMVKERTNKITLAIGDGQNDVPMIKAANIGIGLFGEQGMGAVQASDYGMPQFRMLRRLLFVHGRWNYIRICDMILYFFYKNIIFTIPRLVFGFNSAFSGQRVFDDVYVALYNVAFTVLPLVVRAVLEQDVNYVFPLRKQTNGSELSQDFIKSAIYSDHPEAHCLPPGFQINKYFYKLFPKIYFVGQQNCIFNIPKFLYWVIEAILIGIFLTVITFEIFAEVSIDQHGWSSDLWLASLNLFSGLMIIVTLKLVMRTKYWTFTLVFSIVVVSIGLYIAYMWFSNYIALLSDHILGTTIIMWNTYKSLFFQIFCACLILLIDGAAVTVDFHYGSYASKMRLVVYEQQQYNKNFLKLMGLPIGTQTQQMEPHANDFMIQNNQ